MSRWQVITGGPCSGKTTIIDELTKLGYQTKPEVARKYLGVLFAFNKKGKEQRSPMVAQNAILEAKIARERRLDREELIFFDRGLPDSVAYFRMSELDDSDALDACSKTQYEHIFFLESLPLKQDAVRHETPEQAAQLSKLLFSAYKEIGYEPIKVPVMPVKERVEFILNNI